MFHIYYVDVGRGVYKKCIAQVKEIDTRSQKEEFWVHNTWYMYIY